MSMHDMAGNASSIAESPGTAIISSWRAGLRTCPCITWLVEHQASWVGQGLAYSHHQQVPALRGRAQYMSMPPIPPPMPPIPPPPAGGDSFLGASTTMASEVVSRLATLAASNSAVRTTCTLTRIQH